MPPALACLVRGKLVVLTEGEEPRELSSAYAEARTVGLCRGRSPDELFYALSTGAGSGIFAQAAAGSEERRIYHAADVDLFDLAFDPDESAVACSVRQKAGSTAIGILADDGHGLRTVTEGDVVDRDPRWVPGGTRQIVYASAGIGRTSTGARAGLAPFSLHRLSLADGTVEVFVASRELDYVAPVPESKDVIYAIRRPYRDRTASPKLTRVLADALLAPFRAAGYELVRVTRSGVEVVARGALAFDIAPDGTLYYSDGRRVFRTAEGKTEPVFDLAHVDQIVVCDPTGPLTTSRSSPAGDGARGAPT